MNREPARILESRHWTDEALCRELVRLKSREPSAAELGAVFEELERDLGAQLRETLSEADSGVRVLPRPLREPTPVAAAVVQQPVASLPERARRRKDSGFWSNAVVSRTLAAFSAAAALALIWSWSERSLDVGREDFEHRAQIAPSAAVDFAQASESIGFERRTQPSGAPDGPSPLLAAEQAKMPVTRARLATSPTAGRTRASGRAAEGKLNINSIPYSRVVLDGRPLGSTPRVEVAVSPGPHTVVFVHPEHGRVFKEVYVDSGRTVLAAVRFQ